MFKKKNKEAKIKTPRFQTFRDAYKVTKSVKPWIGIALLAIFVVVLVVGISLGFIFGHPIYGGFVTIPLAALATMFFFTRVAGTAAYSSIEGQIGAGASVLMAIRKGWTTTPAVAVNRQQDMVHRSVGRAGIVITGEGGFAVRQMMQDEKKKSERFAPGVPVTEVYVGDGDGQVPLRKLQKHLAKLPKKLSAHQMREVRARLKAVGGMSLPIPKGPMPKGTKIR
ncbi:MFS_MdfA_MDR_like domain containing protein [Candidatus Nanopelagicaceae bacterium]